MVCGMELVPKGVLGAFSDADFAGDVKTRQSTSGVVAMYAGSATA
jgi:hypothetical protein